MGLPNEIFFVNLHFSTGAQSKSPTAQPATPKTTLLKIMPRSLAYLDTLTYFSSAAIAFAFKTCQIFAIGAFVIWRIIFHVSYPILPLFSVIYVFRGRYAVGNCISEL